MTFAEKFETIQNDLLARNSADLADGIAVQVTLSDEDVGGTFYIAKNNGAFSVEPFDYVDNTAIVDTAAAVLDSILAGTKAAADAVADGSLAVQGNTEDVIAVLSLAKPAKKTAKKAPAKKAASKKAPAKKSTAKKPAAKKTAAKKTTASKKTTAAKKSTAAKKTSTAKKTTSAKKSTGKK